MKNLLAYLAIIASMIFWSFSFIWSKEALNVYGPLTILVSRLSLASITLLSFAKIIGRLQKIQKNHRKYFFLLAFFEPFLYFIGETYGLTLVSPTIAAVIIATIPLFLPFVGWYYYKESITIYKILGTLLSFIGVLLVIINYQMNINANIWGVGLLLLAVFAAIGYTVVLNKLSHQYNPFTIVGWQSTLAIIGFLPLFLIIEWQEVKEIGFVWEGMQPIILLGLIASIFAFLLYTYSIRILGITRTGIFANIIPVFTALFSFFVLGERLLKLNYLGIFIVVVGLLLAQKKSAKV
ncbi:MAG: hypothetical protein B7C24_03710 [Bacteroidetes bacterium 4572_77]|nr:MAG: hypothetical protein B7C24_03710 [Bacteroidetes bacterium 4572_77]